MESFNAMLLIDSINQLNGIIDQCDPEKDAILMQRLASVRRTIASALPEIGF
jgi:hypothetical protein